MAAGAPLGARNMEDKMSIAEKANDLGLAIVADPRFIRFAEMREKQEADTALQNKIDMFNSLKLDLAELAEDGSDEERARELEQQLKALYSEIASNPVMQAYMEAKAGFDAIMKEINDILAFHLTGEEPHDEGCSGGCSSCSGCH